jgi:hypothetical protein
MFYVICRTRINFSKRTGHELLPAEDLRHYIFLGTPAEKNIVSYQQNLHQFWQDIF